MEPTSPCKLKLWCISYGERNFLDNILRHDSPKCKGLLVQFVQRRIHDFHTNPDVPFPEKGPVKLHCERTVNTSHRYVQIHEQPFLFHTIDCSGDPLDIKRRKVQWRSHRLTPLHSHSIRDSRGDDTLTARTVPVGRCRIFSTIP